MTEFIEFPKIPRLSRECVVTEKIDGTNAQITIKDGKVESIGSRTRFITPEQDNFGFAGWVRKHESELIALGEGTHFGEWWGVGIQRGYGLTERRFSLFNVSKWNKENVPACASVVPVLYRGIFDTSEIAAAVYQLKITGSQAEPGFMKPEGIVIYHTAAGRYFKKTVENDEKGKEN